MAVLCALAAACREPAPPGAPAPAPSTPAVDAAAAPKPAPTWEVIASGDCRHSGDLIDVDDGTLVVGDDAARLYTPGSAVAASVKTAIPHPHGRSGRFTSRPYVIEVDRAEPRGIKPDTINVLGYYLYAPAAKAITALPESEAFPAPTIFGDYPEPLPVEGGKVVVTYVHRDKDSGDPSFTVPAGNGTAAQLLANDGTITPVAGWPDVMFRDIASSPHAVWALVMRPRQAGYFILRMPLAGEPKFFAIPRTQTCRGDERLTYPARLREDDVTDDGVVVDLEEGECIAKAATGRFKLTSATGRWDKLATPPDDAGAPASFRPDVATVRGAVITVDGVNVTVERNGAIEHSVLEPAGGKDLRRELVVTAGGKEAWIQSWSADSCSLVRYVAP
jgi:hypothetical protein